MIKEKDKTAASNLTCTPLDPHTPIPIPKQTGGRVLGRLSGLCARRPARARRRGTGDHTTSIEICDPALDRAGRAEGAGGGAAGGSLKGGRGGQSGRSLFDIEVVDMGIGCCCLIEGISGKRFGI